MTYKKLATIKGNFDALKERADDATRLPVDRLRTVEHMKALLSDNWIIYSNLRENAPTTSKYSKMLTYWRNAIESTEKRIRFAEQDVTA
jgi:hypothetical protein